MIVKKALKYKKPAIRTILKAKGAAGEVSGKKLTKCRDHKALLLARRADHG